jgi:trehalose synthase
MLQPVGTGSVDLASYAECGEPSMLAQIRAESVPLRGVRVAHINATADGGGVAEILRSLVPLLSDLKRLG